jgi:hypothetical protein
MRNIADNFKNLFVFQLLEKHAVDESLFDFAQKGSGQCKIVAG